MDLFSGTRIKDTFNVLGHAPTQILESLTQFLPLKLSFFGGSIHKKHKRPWDLNMELNLGCLMPKGIY